MSAPELSEDSWESRMAARARARDAAGMRQPDGSPLESAWSQGPCIAEGSYLLWFAKFGHLEFQQMDTLEDAVELVVRLRDQSTTMAEVDEYGVPDALERVGSDVVEDFFELCDAREEQNAREWAEELKRARSVNPGPRYSIQLSPPAELSPFLPRSPGHLVGGLDGEQVIVERDRLEALFGRDRVTVRQERPAEATS